MSVEEEEGESLEGEGEGEGEDDWTEKPSERESVSAARPSSLSLSALLSQTQRERERETAPESSTVSSLSSLLTPLYSTLSLRSRVRHLLLQGRVEEVEETLSSENESIGGKSEERGGGGGGGLDRQSEAWAYLQCLRFIQLLREEDVLGAIQLASRELYPFLPCALSRVKCSDDCCPVRDDVMREMTAQKDDYEGSDGPRNRIGTELGPGPGTDPGPRKRARKMLLTTSTLSSMFLTEDSSSSDAQRERERERERETEDEDEGSLAQCRYSLILWERRCSRWWDC